MLILEYGKDNVVGVSLTSTVDLSTLTCEIDFPSGKKTFTDLTNAPLTFTLGVADVEALGLEKSLVEVALFKKSDNSLYIKYLIEVQVVPEDKAYETIGNQTITLTIPYTFYVPVGGGSGDYVTQKELEEALERSADEIVNSKAIDVTLPSGEEGSVTIKETAQSAVTMAEELKEAIGAKIEDEDDDGQPDEGVLYFDSIIKSGA